MKNPAPQSARGSECMLESPHGSLAVFNVEQVALNRHEQYFKDNGRVYLTADEPVSTRIAYLGDGRHGLSHSPQALAWGPPLQNRENHLNGFQE